MKAAKLKPALYALTPAQLNTVLAALRHYQAALPILAQRFEQIATDEGTNSPLTTTDIDQLCESINHTGLEFSAMPALFGEDENNAYVAAARKRAREGELEVDIPAVVNDSDDGAYVQAWLWVGDDDARTTEIDGYNANIDEQVCYVKHEIKGNTFGALLADLISTGELVCTNGLDADLHHPVARDTIDQIAAWAAIVEATIPFTTEPITE